MFLVLLSADPDICGTDFSATSGPMGHPSGPAKIILICILYGFASLTVYLLIKRARVDWQEWVNAWSRE